MMRHHYGWGRQVVIGHGMLVGQAIILDIMHMFILLEVECRGAVLAVLFLSLFAAITITGE